MHTFQNLLNGAPTTAWSDSAARSARFLHTTGLDRERAIAIIGEMRLSPNNSQRKTHTTAAEEGMSLPPAVYFFAGRAYPASFGNFAVSISLDKVSDGGVTPFDSGGVYAGKSRLPCGTGSARADYVKSHSASMASFHNYFSHFLTAFFDSAIDYWNRPPIRPIDGTVFSSVDDWRDWTFEGRQIAAVAITDADLFMNSDVDNILQTLFLEGTLEQLPAAERCVIADRPFAAAELSARSTVVA